MTPKLGRRVDIALLGTAWLGCVALLAGAAYGTILARGVSNWAAIILLVPVVGTAVLGIVLLTAELHDLIRPTRPGRKP